MVPFSIILVGEFCVIIYTVIEYSKQLAEISALISITEQVIK